ncbi:cupin domain-containing protein [uncultured Sphingomonas sp.]|jgi:mannose-6-phosphate isomerase-like protein (cupin superfamily)|uniref:cupin domain-containing protein n=1 Tax=unclassified Sphingomonas TaxID=196159 RepID=UPI0025F0E49F|nr:cupin domain-containing protein [uncultured Sphingomonas sp.]
MRLLPHLLCLGSAVSISPAVIAQTIPADAASASEIRARVAVLAERMGASSFAYDPLLMDGETVAALEYWKAPGKPAVHPDAAEYAIVIEGAGTLVSGGTLVAPRTTKPGLVEGRRIEGGTSRTLSPGDIILIPAGVPHWFGIEGKLVLLGMKLPRLASADQPAKR